MSQYTNCACRDCFDVAISSNDEDTPAFCLECVDAGCEMDCDCQRADAYEIVDEDDGDVIRGGIRR